MLQTRSSRDTRCQFRARGRRHVSAEQRPSFDRGEAGSEDSIDALKQAFAEQSVRSTSGRVLYHFVPSKARWEEGLALLECGAVNTIKWESGLPLPVPPQSSTWLLPCSDAAGVAIARHRDELRRLGWRVLACSPALVSTLGDKVSLRVRACELGLERHLPRSYASLEAATYPCILKAARGEYGKTVHMVESSGQARKLLRSHAAGFGAGARYVMQELVRGSVEHSLSLLVEDGRIVRALHTRYEYEDDAYVWPRVRERTRESTDTPPPSHMAVLRQLTVGYSGFCNVNYKTRAAESATGGAGDPDTVLAIFEMNMRVGGDVVNDTPKPAARAFLSGLEETAAAAM